MAAERRSASSARVDETFSGSHVVGVHAHLRAKHPPHLRQFLCIHRYEARWTDTGAPYYGGLQMDLGFQRSYGGWLYVVGGISDALDQSAKVVRAPIRDHVLGPWEQAAPLPLGRAHVHQLPLLAGHIFSVAGAIDFDLNSTDAIFVGQFP